MYAVLSEPLLYRFLDYPPPESLEYLQGVYARLESRASPDGKQLWLNWIVIPHGQHPVGFTQATIEGKSASVAYLLASAAWERGYATEATRGMLEHLGSSYGVKTFRATVEVANLPSIRLLERLAFRLATAEECSGYSLTPTERLYVKVAANEHNEL